MPVSLDAPETPEPSSERGSSKGWIVATLVAILLLAAGSYFGLTVLDRLERMDRRLDEMGERVAASDRRAAEAAERALRAEASALEAARGRERAETEAERAARLAEEARKREETARLAADAAREEARRAKEEAERIQREWQAEVDRLESALSEIAETRRTALGLVMNLGSDYLKFDFDKATLKPENKELLSRIAGILLTSKDYTIHVYGHTDDIGTDEYNQKLSERRAQAVRDYLVECGIDPAIISVQGFGKSQPLVPGTSPEARAKNRRVEIGIVNTRIKYDRSVGQRR